MFGNLMKECGAVDRLKRASENEITNIVTLLLGLCIGATMEADKFLRGETLLVLALGFIATACDFRIGAPSVSLTINEVSIGFNLTWHSLPVLVDLVGRPR